MGKPNPGKILSFEFSASAAQLPPDSTALVLDDVGLSDRLAISRKALWWVIMGNTFHNQHHLKRGFYIHHRIPKRGGGFRDIHEPKEVLKNIQKSLLVTFFAQDGAPDHVGAYISKRDIAHTARQHVGARVKISMDIKNFFPSITKRTVYDHLVGEMGFNETVAGLIVKLVTVPIARADDSSKGVFVLPQGSPTSAALSNRIAMKNLDDPVLKYLEGKDATYTRYCDNLEISFQRDLPRDEVDAHVEEITRIIRSTNWRVNQRKTKIQRRTSPKIPMRVLGIGVRDRLGAPPEEYRRLRTAVHIVTRFGVDERFMASKLGERYRVDSFEALYIRLRGELLYWKQIHPAKFQPLIDKLDAYRSKS